MTSNDIANAQKQLDGQREANPSASFRAGLRPARHVGEIDPLAAEAPTWPDLPTRRPQKVTLAALDTSHKKVKAAVQMAYAWAERKRAGYQDASLVLIGPNGVGKTHIARAIWWSMTQAAVDGDGKPIPGTEQPSGHFYLSNDLLGLMGNSRDPETGIVVPARAASVVGYPPLLVLDDVGAEQTIPFVGKDDQEAERHARFFKVFDWCYTAQISMVVTSNLSIAELAQHLGRRSWDRLAEMAPKLLDGRSFMVDLTGVPSWRVRAGGR